MAVHIGKSAEYPKDTFPSSTNIQSLLDGGEKVITLGAGSYSLTTALIVPAGVTLRGDGTGTILNWSSAAVITSMVTLNAGSKLENLLIQRSAGTVTNAVLVSGASAALRGVYFSSLRLSVSASMCSVSDCIFNGASAYVLLNSTSAIVSRNLFQSTQVGVYINSANGNLVVDNQLVGYASANYGVHVDGSSDYNIVHANVISNMQGSPGYGVYWPVQPGTV